MRCHGFRNNPPKACFCFFRGRCWSDAVVQDVFDEDRAAGPPNEVGAMVFETTRRRRVSIFAVAVGAMQSFRKPSSPELRERDAVVPGGPL